MSNPIQTPPESYLINSPEVQEVIHNNVTKDMIWQPSSIVGKYDKGTIVWFSYDRYVKKNNNANNDTPPEDNTDDWMHISDYVAELFNMGFPDKMPELEQSLLILLSSIQNLTDNQNTLQNELNKQKIIPYKNFTDIDMTKMFSISPDLSSPLNCAAAVRGDYLFIFMLASNGTSGESQMRFFMLNESSYIVDFTPVYSDTMEIKGADVYNNIVFCYGARIYKTGENNNSFSSQDIPEINYSNKVTSHAIFSNKIMLFLNSRKIYRTTDLQNLTISDNNMEVLTHVVFNNYLYVGGYRNESGNTGAIKRTLDGTSFETVNFVTGGIPNPVFYFDKSCVFYGSVFFGSSSNDGGFYKSSNGVNFTSVLISGLVQVVKFLVVFKNRLFFGGRSGRIYSSFDGSNFTQIFYKQNLSFGQAFVFKDCLYVTFGYYGLLFSSDGINFEFLDTNGAVNFMAEFKNRLYLKQGLITKKTLTL